MLRRAWKPLAGATVLVGTPTALYYTYMRPPPGPATFDLAVRVRGPDGRAMLSPRTFPLLTRAGADALLRGGVHARTAPGGWRWSTASVASNAPIEDAHASAVLARADAVPGGPEGDLLFFAVMDGHGGYHTSRLLSNILIPAVALELQALAADGDVPAAPQKRSLLDSLLGRTPPAAAAAAAAPPARFDADPTYVSLALQTAFARVDSELINAPIKLLAANIDEKARAAGVLPDLSQHPMALATMQPALSGSCAVLALVDAAHGALYVANTGDARALAGFWDERADGSGSWRVEVLSEDQTGRNPSELARVRAEHPPAEAPYVVQRGRILGGLEPSRAFGDARYKWPRELQELLARAFLGDKPARAPPALLKTPPYVTAQPVVTHRALHARPAPDVVRSTPRFLVLATDGLWDCLSSADVGALVAGHLSGVRGAVPTAKLAARVPLALGSAGISGKDSAAREPPTDTWAFEDEDLGAHLIRNAFGGADEPALRRLLSIPSAHSRNFRDDVTVTVVVFPTEEDAGAVKAKL
jgi:pyruvate dehydrogenase phosphatase